MSIDPKLCLIVVLPVLASFQEIAHAQAYKCAVNGNTVYQQRPCADSGGTGTALKLEKSPPPPAAVPSKVPETNSTPPAAAVQPPPPVEPPKPKKTWVQRRADECLEWYKPRLRDPRSAYYQDAVDDKGILTFTIFATNGYGGFNSRTAACEFVSGVLDDSWTKIHARKNGW